MFVILTMVKGLVLYSWFMYIVHQQPLPYWTALQIIIEFLHIIPTIMTLVSGVSVSLYVQVYSVILSLFFILYRFLY